MAVDELADDAFDAGLGGVELSQVERFRYGHLLPHAARDAVRALGRALERADRDHGPTGAAQAA